MTDATMLSQCACTAGLLDYAVDAIIGKASVGLMEVQVKLQHALTP